MLKLIFCGLKFNLSLVLGTMPSPRTEMARRMRTEPIFYENSPPPNGALIPEGPYVYCLNHVKSIQISIFAEDPDLC